MTRVLSMAEVRSLLSVEDAIELQREAFLALARDRTTAAPNSWLRLRGDQRGWLKLLAAHDETSGGLGVKVLARFPRNPPGRNLGSLLLLFDDQDGTPLAVMDSVYITAVRTAAGAAVATEALARPEPASMADRRHRGARVVHGARPPPLHAHAEDGAGLLAVGRAPRRLRRARPQRGRPGGAARSPRWPMPSPGPTS